MNMETEKWDITNRRKIEKIRNNIFKNRKIGNRKKQENWNFEKCKKKWGKYRKKLRKNSGKL